MAYNFGYEQYYDGDRCYSCNCRPCRCHDYYREQRAAPAFSLDRRIELQAQELARLQDRKEKTEKFAMDFADDDAILFKRTFRKGDRTYTYVAVKTKRGWYVTGKNSNSLSFAQLCEEHLIDADEVWVCKEWEQIS